MTITISASVGELGVNRHIDVVAVQLLLNRAGGSPKPLLPDGIAGPLTKAAIRAFQVRSLDPRLADGRVDPGGPTLARLNQASPEPFDAGNVIRCDPAPSTTRSFPSTKRLATLTATRNLRSTRSRASTTDSTFRGIDTRARERAS